MEFGGEWVKKREEEEEEVMVESEDVEGREEGRWRWAGWWEKGREEKKERQGKDNRKGCVKEKDGCEVEKKEKEEKEGWRR